VALPGLLSGYVLYFHVDTGEPVTTTFGLVSMLYSAVFVLILPPMTVYMAQRYNQLDNDELHEFVVLGLLKGSPGMLAPLLYICAAASRCIMDADDDNPLIKQCGNPILPTFCLTIFLFWSWLISVLVPPIWERTQSECLPRQFYLCAAANTPWLPSHVERHR
jgi:hypothetical protein